jgi:hypothetical protein
LASVGEDIPVVSGEQITFSQVPQAKEVAEDLTPQDQRLLDVMVLLVVWVL